MTQSMAASDNRPPLESTLLPGRGLSSAGWVVLFVGGGLLLVFAVPIFIGYRRARRRQEEGT